MSTNKNSLDLDVYGPLIFWTLLFVCGSSIKFFAYDEENLLLQIPMELTLWSTGIFFTLATTNENARLKRNYQKKADSPGYVIDYEVVVSDEDKNNNRLIYLSLIGLVSWIICVILYYEALAELNQKVLAKYYVFISLSYIICGAITFVAISNAQRAKNIGQ